MIATEKLLALKEYQTAKCIGIYLSMPKSELTTGGILRDAFKKGKRVFVPYIHNSPQDSAAPQPLMDLVALRSLSDYEALQPDAWGIPSIPKKSVGERHRVVGSRLKHEQKWFEENSWDVESSYSKSTVESECLDIVIVPGVAFDRGLRRLGHGKGFYDSFLEHYKSSQTGVMPPLGTQWLHLQLDGAICIASLTSS